jgi:hypothetical protein
MRGSLPVPENDKAIKEQEVIEGGRVFQEGEEGDRPRAIGPTARHRQIVTLLLIGLLAVLILGHYACVAFLEWNSKKVESVNNAFNAALPVVAGLVGSAVTYYFTRGSSSSDK